MSIQKLQQIIGSLSATDQRTANVIRNTIMSAGMKVAALACSLVMVPITIDYLNAENYGIWMAMTSILYWFAFFDVGLGNGMRNYLAESLSLGDYEKARSYFSTAMFLLSGLAIVIACIVVPLVYLFDLNDLFNAHNIDGRFLANVLSVAIIITLVQFVVKNIGMVYIAMQKYAVNDLIIFLGSILSVIVVYILTKTTEPNLMYVIVAFTGLPVLMFIFASIPLLKQYPQLIPSFDSIDTHTAGRIVSKGLGFFVIQITSCLVIFGSANVFISHYCGPEQVTVYNVSYKLFNVLIIGYTILISPLWNAYTDAFTKGDYAWIRKIYRRSMLMWVITVAGGFVGLLCSNWFFHIWLGDSVTIPFEVSLCIFLYVSLFNFNNCVTYLINGLNKIRVQIITSIIATLIFLTIVYIVKGSLGIVGISIAMSVSYLFMAIVHTYQCYLLSNNKAEGIWNK